MEDTTIIGSGLPEAGKSENPNTVEAVKTSDGDTPTAGKPTGKTAKKPKVQLPAEDEFAILLAQVSSCRSAGLTMKWTQSQPGGVVALVMPDVKLCPNNHLYLGEKCNYCLS